ncbi:ABC transporter permease [Mycolicibacterium sp.]|uniref:ABC transporter permease n=1 Tax=Mycolicibacterium sp. TaxID=2320850 RepID=UPI003D127895
MSDIDAMPQTGLQSAPATQRRVRLNLSDSQWVSSLLAPTLVLVGMLVLWEAAVRLGVANPVIIPPPTEVAVRLVDLSGEAFFWQATATTMTETLVGFLIGSVVAWALGTWVGIVDLARKALYPLLVAVQIMPRVALAPVFLTWFGFGITSKIVMAATICFFPVFINVVVGLETVDRDARTLMRSLGATRMQAYRMLSLPSSMPLLFAGLKTAMTLALIGAIVAEFVGASEGMGVLISTFNFQLDVASAFAVIIALMFAGLALYAVVDIADRRLVFWRSHS